MCGQLDSGTHNYEKHPFRPKLEYETRQLWKTSASWEDHMCNVSRQYILGMLPIHPSYGEPVWLETINIQSGLLSLHDFALITTYSEPGSYETEWIDGEGFVVRTRPHLFFTMPTKNTLIDRTSIAGFLESLQQIDSIWYHITYHYSSRNSPVSSGRVFPEYADEVFTNYPGTDVDRFTCSQIMTNFEWVDEATQTFPGPKYRNPGSGGLSDYDEPFQAGLAVDPLQICIVSKGYTTSANISQDLQALVVGLLDAAGLQRLPQPQSQSQVDQNIFQVSDEVEDHSSRDHEVILWMTEAANQAHPDEVEHGITDEGGGNDQDIGAGSDEISSIQDANDDSYVTVAGDAVDEDENGSGHDRDIVSRSAQPPPDVEPGPRMLLENSRDY